MAIRYQSDVFTPRYTRIERSFPYLSFLFEVDEFIAPYDVKVKIKPYLYKYKNVIGATEYKGYSNIKNNTTKLLNIVVFKKELFNTPSDTRTNRLVLETLKYIYGTKTIHKTKLLCLIISNNEEYCNKYSRNINGKIRLHSSMLDSIIYYKRLTKLLQWQKTVHWTIQRNMNLKKVLDMCLEYVIDVKSQFSTLHSVFQSVVNKYLMK